jgi:uncharacterized DUF497 family protein
MIDDEFEWDDQKAAANLQKHGVSFVAARRVFDDGFAIHNEDITAGYSEQRIIAVGMVNAVLMTVVYTERGSRTRIISARRATKHEQRKYYQS